MSEHELWNELGNLYFMSGAYNQAANAYQRSIQADTEFGRPYSNLALTYVQQGKYDDAIELYRRSIELLAGNKERAISLNRLGNVYRHLKNYSQAVVAFQEADELDPHSTDEFPPSAEPRAQAQSILSSVLDEPAAELAYERVETLTDVPFAEPAEEVVAAEEPVAVEEAIIELTEQSIDEIAEEPVAAVAEQPVAVATETPAAENAEETFALAVMQEPIVETAEEPVAMEVEEPVAEIAEQPVAEVVEEPVVAEPEPLVAEVMFEPVAEIPETPDEDIIYEPDAGIEEVPAALAPDEPQEEDLYERMTRRMQFLVGEALDQGATAIADQPVASNEPETEPELEWWDVDEERFENATHSPEPIEDPSTSWTPADLGQFRQDLSQMPDTGSLTTWGDPDFDSDFERWSPLDPDPDVQVPDPDGDNLSRWLPVPEEAPLSMDQLRVPPFVDELEEESEPPSDWDAVPDQRGIDAGSFAPVSATSISRPAPMDTPVHSEPAVAQQKTWERQVDVAVEERPAREVNVAPQQRPSLVEVEPAIRPTQRELVLAPVPEAPAPVPCEPDRDESEMREIELGIEKFRRVVQLNPRNAHAWDALGTLYKSAGQYRDAILAYQQAISNDSSKSLYYHHLGLVYACEGRDEDAISAFQRVIEIDPEYSLAHATLGGYYRKMGLEELAQKHIGKAMKNIFDSENEYNRACLEAICGNTDHAIQLLDVALKNKQTYVDWILRDPDLDFIRQDPRFKQLISRYTR